LLSGRDFSPIAPLRRGWENLRMVSSFRKSAPNLSVTLPMAPATLHLEIKGDIMIYPSRRTILKFAGAFGVLTMGLVTGLVKSSNALAAQWNKAGFESKAMADALKALGASNPVESRDIVITAPEIAENGAVVPVAIVSKIPNTQQISVIAEKNPRPLMATFDVSNGSESYISTRIKMGETSNVWAVVKADGKFFAAKKEVKVTVGGCG
jgi:sulfur-oxidizing protein SoxY